MTVRAIDVWVIENWTLTLLGSNRTDQLSMWATRPRLALGELNEVTVS